MGVVLTAPDAKINTGKFFFEKNANLSTRQINQLYSTSYPFACFPFARGKRSCLYMYWNGLS